MESNKLEEYYEDYYEGLEEYEGLDEYEWILNQLSIENEGEE